MKKKTWKKFGGTTLILSGLLIAFATSCIDQLYDLNNGISKDMALGGDSLSIPIGSTDTIRLGDYLDSETLDILKVMENGGYGLKIEDSIAPETFSIPQENLNFKDQVIHQDIPISNFGDIDLSQFKIDGISVADSISMGLGNYALGSFDLPQVSMNSQTKAGISGYKLSDPTLGNKSISADKPNLLSGVKLPEYSGGPVVELPIDNAQVNVNTSGDIAYDITVPNGISNISDVELSPGAVLEVSIQLVGDTSALKSGSLVPDFDINTGSLFVFETPPANNIIAFEAADALSKANGYKVVRTLNITGINTPSNPINETLSISQTMTTLGNMLLKDATVMSDKLSSISGLGLSINFSVKNVHISSMEFDIPKLNASIPENIKTLNIENTVPSQLDTINKINFNSPATINIHFTADLPPMETSTIKISSLNIEFPDEFVFEPDAHLLNNVYTVTNETFDPLAGKTIQLHLREMDLSKIAINNSKIVWSDRVKYSGSVSFEGRIKSKDIQSSEDDAFMNVAFSSNLSFKSAEVTTKAIPDTIPPLDIPISLPITIDKNVKRLNTLSLQPDTKIQITLKKPALPLTLAARNLVIDFPDIFVFDPPLPIGNTYVMNDALPESLSLTLKQLAINQDLDDGVLNLNEHIRVTGGIELMSGKVNSNDIQSMSSKKMSFKASTSDLSLASTELQLKDLSMHFSDSTAIPIESSGIPKQLISLDSILLKDNASLSITVKINNMPDLKSPLMTDVVIDFPDMFMFNPGSVNASNQLVIKEPFSNDSLTRTIGLHGIKFDGKPLNGSISLSEKIRYSAGVSIASPTVNSDELTGGNISVTVNAATKNIGFSKLYGKLDPKIDPIEQTIELGEIPDFLKDDDVVLDITKPVIALTTETNFGLPIIASAKVTPMNGETENNAAEQSFEMTIPKTENPVNYTTSHFWIAPDSVGMPVGYTFMETPIQNLFRKIPTGVKMHAGIASDLSVQHFFDLTAAYKFKMHYNVTVPFAFGKDLSIKMEKTIEDIDPKLAEQAGAVKGIEIFGDVQNSIPLELHLALIPLDADGNRIPIDTVTQVIQAGAFDGSAVPTSLSLKLDDPNGLLKDLRAFNLIFKATSNSTVAGTPIKPENFVKANLKIRLTGGINVSSFINEEQ